MVFERIFYENYIKTINYYSLMIVIFSKGY